MNRRASAIAALAILAACAGPPSRTTDVPATHTPLTSPSPTASPVTTSSPSPTATFTPSPDPTPFTSVVETPAPIPLDEPWAEPPPRPLSRIPVKPNPPPQVPNARRTFWVTDPASGGRRQITARLRAQGPNVAMWVELDTWHDIRRLHTAVELFQSRIYPRIRTAFGSEWRPGIDNDRRIHVLHATGLGEKVTGYTSSLDEYPREVHSMSNEAELIVINLDYVDIGSSAYNALLARQFQRLVQWNQDRNEERWLKEGLAALGATVSGLSVGEPGHTYLKEPDTSLVYWSGEEAQRDAAWLFAAYFHQRFGDRGMRVLTSEPANGIHGLDAALKKLSSDVSFEDLLADWLAANYLDGVLEIDSSDHSLYTYNDIDLDPPTPIAVYDSYPIEMKTTVKQFGADYVVFQGKADLDVMFTGQTHTPLSDLSPYSGQRAWWSNRADESLTTLTRRIDLSKVEQATLSFRTWYDIEPHHDYATVSVRRLNKEQWHILTTPSGTSADPYGNSPGWSYTGRSDGWVLEQVDLSAYAGEEIWIRFSYLTDGAIAGASLLLDDISVAEIGYVDVIEEGLDGWEAQGFVPIEVSVPQEYMAVLIKRGDQTTIERLSLSKDQTAKWAVPLASEGLREAVLVVSGMTLLAADPAPYQISVTPQEP